MSHLSFRGRIGFCFVLASVLLSNLGARCSTSLPSQSVTVELINNTIDPVNPGLFVDGTEFIIDPDAPDLAPGEIVTLEFDCTAGTRFDTEATLFTPTEDVFSDNVPIAEENFEFFCGETLSFIFIDDGQTFFTRLEVNGHFVSD